MSLSCPDCKHRFEPSAEAKETTVVCPECKTEFPLPTVKDVDLEPGQLVGGYEIVRLVGAGGMGKVYEAVQISLQRKVALKVIQTQMVESDPKAKRFLMEVRSTASLEHPNIVTVFEASQEQNILYLAMELVKGVTLDQMLKDAGGPLGEAQAWRYALQVCDAMNYAWKYQQLLHRDIKPANIMVLEDGTIKICDLGIAKRPGDEVDMTHAGMAIGTPNYMSPEQGRGEVATDFRADVYSLGATLFHLLTGRVPYSGSNAVMVITKHVVEEVPDPKEVNPELSDASAKMIELMMAKKPKDRHPSWDAVRRDVEEVIQGHMPIFEPEIDHSESAFDGEEGPIVPARSASRKRRRKMDIDAIKEEVYRNDAHSRVERGGWRLVRIGYLCLALVATVASVAYLYRQELFPEIFKPERAVVSNQVLMPDDGTDPAPEANGVTSGIDDAAQTEFRDLLSTIPTTPSAEEGYVRSIVDRVKGKKLSVVSFAQFCVAEKRENIAIMVSRFALKTPGVCPAEEMGALCTGLVHQLRVTGRESIIPTVYQTAIQRADAFTERDAALSYIGLAGFHWRENRLMAGQTLLKSGLRRFVQEKRLIAADSVATALIHHLEAQTAHGNLYTTCQSIVQSLPADSDAHTMAQSVLKRMTEVPDGRLPIPEENPGLRYHLRHALNGLAKGRPLQTVLPDVVTVYLEHRQYEKVNAYCDLISKTYSGLDDGEMVGRLLLKVADHYAASNRTRDYCNTLDQIVITGAYGKDNRHGLTALTRLSDYYKKSGDKDALTRTRCRLIHLFPGPEGDRAGQLMIALAEEYVATNKPALALRLLKKVQSDFPGPAGKHADKALELITAITAKFPKAATIFEEKQAQFGPFAHVISPAEMAVEQIVIDSNRPLAGGCTIEFWARVSGSGSESMPILHCSGVSDSMVTFSAMPDVLAVTIGTDGNAKTHRVTAKLQQWTHVVLTSSVDKGTALFVNGERILAVPNLHADLKILRRVWIDSSPESLTTSKSCAIQHLVISKGGRYSNAVRPKTLLPDIRGAVLAVSNTAAGIQAFKGSRLNIKP